MSRALLLLGLLLPLCALAQPAPVVHLQPDEVAIIGYGSLMSRESMERSLQHPYTAEMLQVGLKGWKRTWNVGMPNNAFYLDTPQGKVFPDKIAYLNIQKNVKTTTNAMLFVVKKSELEQFNRREWIYDPVDVTQDLQGIKVEGGRAVAYVGKNEYLLAPEEQFPQVGVRRSYVEALDKALAAQTASYRRQFRASSAKPPPTFADRKEEAADPFGYQTAAKPVLVECAKFFAEIPPGLASPLAPAAPAVMQQP